MPPTLVTKAAFAKLHGVSKQAVAKWETRGFLAFREGKVWVERSDQALEHAGLGRFVAKSAAAAGQPVDPPASTGEPASSTGEPPRASPPSALADLEEALQDPAADPGECFRDFLERFSRGQFGSIREAETIKANALAAKRLLEARQLDGQLVDIEEAERILFLQARTARDAWLNFPTQVGPLLAADLGVEAGRVVEALTAHVHRQVEELGEPQADFTPPQD